MGGCCGGWRSGEHGGDFVPTGTSAGPVRAALEPPLGGSHWRGAGTSLPLKLALHENVAPWPAPPLGLVGFGSMPVLDKGAS